MLGVIFFIYHHWLKLGHPRPSRTSDLFFKLSSFLAQTSLALQFHRDVYMCVVTIRPETPLLTPRTLTNEDLYEHHITFLLHFKNNNISNTSRILHENNHIKNYLWSISIYFLRLYYYSIKQKEFYILHFVQQLSWYLVS